MFSNRFFSLGVGVLFLLLFWTVPARAQFQDVFGLGGRNAAMGSASTATATDYSAVYYNPAGLAYSRPFEGGWGAQYGFFGGFDVTVEKDSQAAEEAEDVEDIFGFHMGVSLTFGGEEAKRQKDKEIPCEVCGTTVRLSTTKCPVCKSEFQPVELEKTVRRPPRYGLGFALHLPFKDLVRGVAADPREPSVYFYDNNIRKVAFYLGGALRVTNDFSLGVGLALFADANVAVTVTQPISGGVDVGFEETLAGDAAPIVGLRYQPAEKLWLGLTYRGELSLKVDGTTEVVALGITALDIKLQSIVLFTPHQVALGMGYEFNARWNMAFDLTYYNWSSYETTANFVENQPGSIPITTENPPEIPMVDVVVPRLGLEYIYSPQIAFRMGYSYYPSPVKKQSGETNILESDRHTLTMGAGFKFSFLNLTHHLDLFTQIHILSPRQNKKDDPSDFYGDTSLEGFFFNLGFSLKTNF